MLLLAGRRMRRRFLCCALPRRTCVSLLEYSYLIAAQWRTPKTLAHKQRECERACVFIFEMWVGRRPCVLRSRSCSGADTHACICARSCTLRNKWIRRNLLALKRTKIRCSISHWCGCLKASTLIHFLCDSSYPQKTKPTTKTTQIWIVKMRIWTRPCDLGIVVSWQPQTETAVCGIRTQQHTVPYISTARRWSKN